jgi:hypothetical protein
MKQFIIDCIQSRQGDDLFRAKAAFRGLSYVEMQKQHGQSGKTRQQILDEYAEYSKKCKDAIAWVNQAN